MGRENCTKLLAVQQQTLRSAVRWSRVERALHVASRVSRMRAGTENGKAV